MLILRTCALFVWLSAVFFAMYLKCVNIVSLLMNSIICTTVFANVLRAVLLLLSWRHRDKV